MRTTKEINQRGITLIALVITIIVMLILVSVTISMAVNGGLFEYAGKAVEEMQNAINAEQQLANGKIKIGGKWYASLKDYINNNPIKSGIEIDLAEITLKKKESEEVEGEEILTQEITASVFGMDTEPEITWEVTPADQTAITLSATTGKTVTITAVGTEETTATITAKCTYEGEEYEETRDVTLEIIKKPVEVARGDFVYYDVEYKDVYNDKIYENTFGWRLLHYDKDEDGNLYNVELISTGIPAILNYSPITYNAQGNNKWWITNKTAEFQTALQNYYGDGTSSYTFKSDTGNNVYGAAGMYYNFENILFYTESKYSGITNNADKYNLGWYRSIKVNNKPVEKDAVGSDLFLTSSDYSLRTLTLPEINNDTGASSISFTSNITEEPAKGLYSLQNIKDILGLNGCAYSMGNYWLASPYVSGRYDLCYVTYRGGSNYNNSQDWGVRPVIQFKTDTHYTVQSNVDDSGIEYLILTPVA